MQKWVTVPPWTWASAHYGTDMWKRVKICSGNPRTHFNSAKAPTIACSRWCLNFNGLRTGF